MGGVVSLKVVVVFGVERMIVSGGIVGEIFAFGESEGVGWWWGIGGG